MNPQLPQPPATHSAFIKRYPELGQAWESIAAAGKQGPLDTHTARLVKLGIAIGAMREGAVHASARKAQAMGIEREALEQVVALAAGTLGMPATVAVHTWVQDVLGG
jgi:alkylhydroperoxidase/carboxymuconolactone decarboxylase family protein YurZ